ncbi:MAG TPA: ATP-binding protein [Candidatus Dormibacteraeota bacterium]|nr:ATP-binding protein [Candidatus Dormibacteraeota bacterium]
MDTAEVVPVDGKLRLVRGVGAKPKRGAAQLERSHDAATMAIAAVSSYLASDEHLPSYFARLSATIAQVTGATRAAFWRLGPRGTLAVQVAPHGFPNDSPIYSVRLQLDPHGRDALERLVFAEELELSNGTSAGLDRTWREAGLADVTNSIGASWTAGGRRIGALVAFDSPNGFTTDDLWVLRLVGMVAGVKWQYKESEDELGHTAVRLEEAVAARRHLLNNIAAGGDEARRRFASALHDDSLQLLTGAELQLERIRSDAATSPQAGQLDQLRHTLLEVEDSLRRLLTNVSPEPLQLPGDLNSAISDRLESMRVRAGIEANIDARVPSDLPPPIQAIAVKNIAEALNNVEKHAHATRVAVVAEGVDGGLRVEIADDGTGFVVAESVRVPGHIGLVAMRERAQLAGGWCRIESEPGAGTRIRFWVPRSQ